jgi:type IV secretory pathway VirB3-like protein
MNRPRPAARGLNRPRLIFGIDQKLLGLCLIFAVVVAANGSKIAGLILFLALAALGRRMAGKDPHFFEVLNQSRRQQNMYDPMKAIDG